MLNTFSSIKTFVIGPRSFDMAKTDNTSAVADHVKTTGHNIKWDHFEILASGKTDYHCKIKETLFIQELKPAFNVNVSSEKLMLY